MHRRFRQVFTSVKEHTNVSLAKIATIGGFCDLDLVVVKATSPDDVPLPERYVHELLNIFSISPSSFRAFSLSFTRRFCNTQCWRVALKCLLLVHRLLRSLPDSSPFRSEFRWTRSNGYLSLYPCRFRDFSSSAFEDYTIFIRSYAQLLEEALDCRDIGSKEIEELEEVNETPQPDKMKKLGLVIDILPEIQSLIDRVMDCRPTGRAARSFVVQSAMKYIIRDSFLCYTTFAKEMAVVLDNIIQFPYNDCVAAFEIYKKAALQANQLGEFYEWCKSMGLCGAYEYPYIERIPDLQVRALGAFLHGISSFTYESSTSSTTSLTSTQESHLSSTEKEGEAPEFSSSINDTQESVRSKTDKREVHALSTPQMGEQPVRSEIMASTKESETKEYVEPKNLEKPTEMEPLIQFEDDNNVSWESLLEASITPPFVAPTTNFFLHPNNGNQYQPQYNNYSADESMTRVNQWQIQKYTPYPMNPFYQQYNIHYNGSWTSNPTCPWGL